jgi:2-oxo-3-hexenedioate decarboxylase
VHSLFPGWRFSLGDSVAAGGLHGALLVGPAVPSGRWAQDLPALRLVLSRDGEVVETGRGENVLGGPLSALRHLVDTLHTGGHPPLAAGEIVTTGTLTDAWPVRPGEVWTARYEGVPLEPITARFAR